MDIRYFLGDFIEGMAVKLNKGVYRIRILRIKLLEMRGADFGGRIMQDELGYTKEEGNDYTPSWGFIRKLFYNRITPEDSIMDMGCGKGYALYIMGKFKFKHIFGIEISDKLCKIAEKNMNILYPGDKRFHIYNVNATNLLNGGAATRALIASNYLYIYNSFPLNILKIVVDELVQLVEEKDCTYTIFYASPSPECLELMMNDVHFSIVKEHFSERGGAHVYEFKSHKKGYDGDDSLIKEQVDEEAYHTQVST